MASISTPLRSDEFSDHTLQQANTDVVVRSKDMETAEGDFSNISKYF